MNVDPAWGSLLWSAIPMFLAWFAAQVAAIVVALLIWDRIRRR